MISLFLLGLLAVIASIVIIAVTVMCGKWLKEYVSKKLKNRKRHKVAFADSKEVVDDFLKNKVDDMDGVSMSDLEQMCEKAPFVAAVVDEEGEISEYEGFTAEECNENFMARMKQQNGMIILEA